MIKPIALVTGYRDGYPVVQPTDGATVLPVGMALYGQSTPEDTVLLRQCLRALQGIYIEPAHLDFIADWWPECMETIIVLRDRLGDKE
jgi:hypothetical protein